MIGDIRNAYRTVISFLADRDRYYAANGVAVPRGVRARSKEGIKKDPRVRSKARRVNSQCKM